MKGKEAFQGLLLVVGIAGAFGVGFLFAKGSEDSPGDRVGFLNDLTAGSAVVAVESRSLPAGETGSWLMVKERVYKSWKASPAVVVDFEL